MMMGAKYDDDVVAWANEQAQLIRSGKFALLDLEHIADEIEDVGKAEIREFANRVSSLLANLLMWQHQPDRRGRLESTIRLERKQIAFRCENIPSLRVCFADEDWVEMVWADAIVKAIAVAWPNNLPDSISDFSDKCPWLMTDVIMQGWFPQATI